MSSNRIGSGMTAVLGLWLIAGGVRAEDVRLTVAVLWT